MYTNEPWTSVGNRNREQRERGERRERRERREREKRETHESVCVKLQVAVRSCSNIEGSIRWPCKLYALICYPLSLLLQVLVMNNRLKMEHVVGLG